MAGLVVVTVDVQLLIRASQPKLPETVTKRWKRAGIANFLALLILVLYPEQLIDRTATHLFTIAVADCLLFAPMRLLLIALVPYKEDEARIETPARRRSSNSSYLWGIVLLGGALVGAFAFLGEISEGGGAPPVGRLVLVASVLIGLGIAGLLIAYAFLGKPLGFGSRALREAGNGS